MNTTKAELWQTSVDPSQMIAYQFYHDEYTYLMTSYPRSF